jgi:arylformamidase
VVREKRQNSLQEASLRSMWIDISIPLRNAMVHWPGDPEVRIERVLDLEHGDSHTLSQISMGLHTGTHIDAPLHFVRKGVGIDKMPLDITIGRARVIEIHDPESIKAEELVHHRIRRGERILFKTQNSSHVWQTDEFVEDFVFLTQEAAHFLAECQVRLVGIDYLSVGGFKRDGSRVHQVLLGAGIWIIEGLNLSLVGPGRFDLICLPIKLERGDGAPARAVLRQGRTTGVRRK